MSEHQPTPDTVLRLINGYWSTGIIGAAAGHRLFTHLDDGAHSAQGLAERAGISPRGAQSLLDGLVSIGLVHLEEGTYRNSPEADAYLVEGRPADLSAMARLKLTHMGSLTGLADVVAAGGPVSDPAVEVADNPHWGQVVPAIAAQSVPAAAVAADVLGLDDAGPLSILDIGGGSGIYSATWLKRNPAARATQLDWEPINAIARRLLAERGLSDRFTCIDGDFHHTDFGQHAYDVAVYSHIAHQEGPEDNIAVFTRLKDALKPGGALIVCDYVVDDDRSGPAFPLLFACEMLLKSKQGGTWRRTDYHAWLSKAGFSDITFHAAPPATLVIAR
ncbi:class I SAM-dependent methyltransferase [Streptomyces sp. NPDC048518]|uniref:class I SAM-dependent methyltransferase n=1 Tax=Streptomyces sp. NPDC048518 TaxID=3155029 RepID=UPI0033D968FB